MSNLFLLKISIQHESHSAMQSREFEYLEIACRKPSFKLKKKKEMWDADVKVLAGVMGRTIILS